MSASLPHSAAVEPRPAPELALLASPEQESRLFWSLRRRTLATHVAQLLATSRLRVSLVVSLSLFFWLGLFFLFLEGFQFLKASIEHSGMHEDTVGLIYSAFFASLMLMLVFSAGIILYSGLYLSRETAFLLSTPVRPARIVINKFQEAIVVSSWGFLLLGSPMLVAYGVVADAPWYYFAMLPPYMLSFVFIPGGLGALACLLIVHFLPRLKLHALLAAALAALLLAVLWGRALLAGPASDLLTPSWMQEMLGRLRFSEHRLLPSWWLSTGLLQAAHARSGGYAWSDSVMFLALLVSNALLFHQLVVWVGGRLLRASYSGLYTGRSQRRRVKVAWLDRVVMAAGRVLPAPLRLLVVKDLRLFRRDPAQWSQFLIFFGLLVMYFLNIRRFHYDREQVLWIHMISFLNLAVVGLILSTFTTRFIFPMISLEGRRFWILGLLPVRREEILWGKFLFAAAGSIIPCTGLILLSDLMLRISPVVVLVHQVTCVLLCIGLAGIAVGLGARMPDLRENSPSKIAAGFGGTLNLVLSTAYIIAVVALTAVPSHLYLAARAAGWGPSLAAYGSGRLWMAGGMAAAVALCAVSTIWPMALGIRWFRRLEP
jgi:ABC-2 type transport system permease protein